MREAYFWLIVTYDDGHVARLPMYVSIEQAAGVIRTYERMRCVTAVELQFK